MGFSPFSYVNRADFAYLIGKHIANVCNPSVALSLPVHTFANVHGARVHCCKHHSQCVHRVSFDDSFGGGWLQGREETKASVMWTLGENRSTIMFGAKVETPFVYDYGELETLPIESSRVTVSTRQLRGVQSILLCQ